MSINQLVSAKLNGINMIKVNLPRAQAELVMNYSITLLGFLNVLLILRSISNKFFSLP